MFAKLLLAVAITFLPSYALADLITFDNFNQNPLAGSHTEGAFTYQVPAGSTSYAVFNNIGEAPAPLGALITGGGALGSEGGATPGALLNIFLTGGGLFTFTSLRISSTCDPTFNCFLFDPPPGPGNPDVTSVDILGIRGGVQQYLLTDRFTTQNSFGSLINPNAGIQIDTLQFRINRAGTGRQILDNINLTPIGAVAEPGTLLLLVSGLAGLTGMRFSRSRKK